MKTTMATNDNKYSEADLQAAVKCLRDGGIILYPTDTIWGIGCDARNEEAVKRIYNLKKRADSKSMLTLVDGLPMLENTVEMIPDAALQLLEVSVRPLTIIYDRGRNVASNLIGPDGSLGVRVTKEKFSRDLCHVLRRPIVSTSANISGEKAPADFCDISDVIKAGVDYIVKYRQSEKTGHSPSNIIKVSDNGVVNVLR